MELSIQSVNGRSGCAVNTVRKQVKLKEEIVNPQ